MRPAIALRASAGFDNALFEYSRSIEAKSARGLLIRMALGTPVATKLSFGVSVKP